MKKKKSWAWVEGRRARGVADGLPCEAAPVKRSSVSRSECCPELDQCRLYVVSELKHVVVRCHFRHRHGWVRHHL